MPYIDPYLRKFEKKIYSQQGEDGVLEKLAEYLGIETGTFFEFGIGPAWQHTIDEGLEGNFVLLRKKGWTGTFIDGESYPAEVDVKQHVVTALNINNLFDVYNIPKDVDFMSIDVDGQEFWIWMALMYKPKVVVVEYNGSLPKDSAITIQFDVTYRWDITQYHGASLLALDKLAKCKGYTLVYANGVKRDLRRRQLCFEQRGFFRRSALQLVEPLRAGPSQSTLGVHLDARR